MCRVDRMYQCDTKVPLFRLINQVEGQVIDEDVHVKDNTIAVMQLVTLYQDVHNNDDNDDVQNSLLPQLQVTSTSAWYFLGTGARRKTGKVLTYHYYY